MEQARWTTILHCSKLLSETSYGPPPMDSPKTRLEVQVLGRMLECRDGDVIGRSGTVAPDLFADLPEFANRHLIIGKDDRAWFFHIPENVKAPVMLDGEPA